MCVCVRLFHYLNREKKITRWECALTCCSEKLQYYKEVAAIAACIICNGGVEVRVLWHSEDLVSFCSHATESSNY